MIAKAARAEATRLELGERVMLYEAGVSPRVEPAYGAMRAEDYGALNEAWQTYQRLAREALGKGSR